MKLSQFPLAASLFAAAGLTTLNSTAHAQVFVESGNAGQTLATAQSTVTATGALTTINGSFSNASDADLYVFKITSAGTFSATTVNTITNASGVDTALFLFNASGVAIATNDDASGTSFDSTLPSGNSLFASLAAGTYYLGISSSGNEAVNSANQLLFVGYPGGDTTAVRGAASGVNPTTLSTFNSNEYDTTTFGPYQINLTGSSAFAAVPEPSTWAALALGGIAAGITILRRRTA